MCASKYWSIILPFINAFLTEAVGAGQDEVCFSIHADTALLLISQLLHSAADNTFSYCLNGIFQCLCFSSHGGKSIRTLQNKKLHESFHVSGICFLRTLVVKFNPVTHLRAEFRGILILQPHTLLVLRFLFLPLWSPTEVLWAQKWMYLPIHMLAWQESVEGSMADGSLVALSADSTSAAWLVMSRYNWMNWYRFMMRNASIVPVSLLIWKEEKKIYQFVLTWLTKLTGKLFLQLEAC